MKKVIVFAFALVSLSAAQAQEKRFRGGGNKDHNLTEKLNLSEEQKVKAKKLNEEYRKNMMDLRKKDDIPVKEWRSRREELNKKHRDDFRGLLSKEQRDQMEKMRTEKRTMSESNANARMEKMKSNLGLTNDQVEKLKKQRSETSEKMKAIRENKSLDETRKREEMKGLMNKRKENMRSILTEDQMKKMQEMKKQDHHKRKMVS